MPIARAVLRFAVETPLVLFVVAFVAAWALLRRRPSDALRSARLAEAAGLLSVAVLLAIMLRNIAAAGLGWPDEINSLSIAAAYTQGQPLYPDFHSAVMYALPYGPAYFLFYTPFLAASAHCIVAIRTVMFLLMCVTVLAMYAIARRQLDRARSLALLSIVVASLITVPRGVLAVCPDPLLLVFVSVSVAAALKENSWLSALVAGACCGLMVNCKLTLAAVAVLTLALMWRRRTTRELTLASVATVLFAALPFALRGVSAREYLRWVVLIGHQGFAWHLFAENVLFAVFLLISVTLLEARRQTLVPAVQSRDVLLGLLFAGNVLLDVFTGSKNGSGVWHLWPLLPFVVGMAAWGTARAPLSDHSQAEPGQANDRQAGLWQAWPGNDGRALAAVALAMLVVTLRFAHRDLALIRLYDPPGLRARLGEAEAEMRADLQASGGHVVAMSSGSSVLEPILQLRYQLPLQGQRYVLDPVTFGEVAKSVSHMPGEITAEVLGCREAWLVPHGEVPFSTENYTEMRYRQPFLFENDLRLGYPATHTVLRTGKAFDLWGCAAK